MFSKCPVRHTRNCPGQLFFYVHAYGYFLAGVILKYTAQYLC